MLIAGLDGPPGGDQHLRILGVVGEGDVDGAVVPGDRGEGLGVRGSRGGVRLHDEDSADGIIHAEVTDGVDETDGDAVHHLQHRRGRAGGHVGGHGVGGGAHIREGREGRQWIGAQRDELEGGFDDDAEGALGAGEQGGEVESGDALDSAVAQAGDGAVGQDDRDLADVLAGHTVFHAAHASGVGGDIAADRAQGD